MPTPKRYFFFVKSNFDTSIDTVFTGATLFVVSVQILFPVCLHLEVDCKLQMLNAFQAIMLFPQTAK